MTDTVIPEESRALLIRYAAEYETAEFLEGDPSWFMHQVNGARNREVTAFVASCLSYGSRKQFMPKIAWLVDRACGDLYEWILSGKFAEDVPACGKCFYRLYDFRQMNLFLGRLQQMLQQYGTMGCYVGSASQGNALQTVENICRWFAEGGDCIVVPKNAVSSCKRICMFLRWMVRSNSPVDLGLWADAIDRRTLIMPLDTHVLQQSVRLGLLKSKTATMSTALRLTGKLAEIFPDDPLKGDFALFGYGVNKGESL
mgnify:CR=1 FL=1